MNLVQQLSDLVDLHNKYCCKITLAEFSQVLFVLPFSLLQTKQMFKIIGFDNGHRKKGID